MPFGKPVQHGSGQPEVENIGVIPDVRHILAALNHSEAHPGMPAHDNFGKRFSVFQPKFGNVLNEKKCFVKISRK